MQEELSVQSPPQLNKQSENTLGCTWLPSENAQRIFEFEALDESPLKTMLNCGLGKLDIALSLVN